MEDFTERFENVFTVLKTFLLELFPYPVLLCLKSIVSLLIYFRLFPYSSEFVGMAKVLKQHPGELALGHLTYEITAFCTSVIINDRSHFGTAINLRTMDWSMPFDLRDLTAKIHFVDKQDRIQFTSVQFIGGCGVLTAMKPNRFGIVVNFRNSAYHGVDASSWITCKTVLGFLCNFGMMLIGGWTVQALIRYICENARDYQEAVAMAKSKWLIAPAYLTITGIAEDEGVILTRDRLCCVDENRVDGKEYVVQCNADHWTVGQLNECSDIYESKERVEKALQMLPLLTNDGVSRSTRANIVDTDYNDEQCLSKERREFVDKCWRFLSLYPIMNEETVYGNIIVPKYGLILSARTTQDFQAVSAAEFANMFYISGLEKKVE